MSKKLLLMVAALALLLASCADKSNTAVTCIQECHTYGFWGGLWHGSIAVFDFIGMLIWPNDVTVYAENNNGGWYSFGFLVGIGAFAGSGVKIGKRK